jgi:hypothetical protein
MAAAPPAYARSQQLGQVTDDHVGPVRTERIGLADAVDAEDDAEASRPPCLHAGERVLEHARLCGFETEGSSPGQEGVGCGLAVEMLSLGGHAVDCHFKELGDAGRNQDVTSVGAGGDDGAPQPGAECGPEVADQPS